MKIKISQTENSVNTSSQRQPNPCRRIFVVENNADSRRLNSEVLIYAGYHVDTAEDGSTAWDMLQLNCYDLLVTDHNMPKLSGVELLKKLHAARVVVPVILVAGTIPTERLKRHPWLQIDATLLKPYTADELLALVRNVLHANDNAFDQFAPPYRGEASWQQLVCGYDPNISLESN